MPENPSTQDEIHALLKTAQQGSEAVKDLTFSLLKVFRKECGEVFRDHQVLVASQLLETGTQEEGMQDDLVAKIDGVRQKLKERLETLLRTADDAKL